MTKLTDEYYLVFIQGDHWVSRWLKKDCSHVLVYAKDKYNWIKLDPSTSKLMWEICPYSVSDHRVPYYLHPRARIIKIRTSRNAKWFAKWRFSHCVNFVSYSIGIKIKALTPWRFYKKLIKLANKPYPAKHICYLQVLK